MGNRVTVRTLRQMHANGERIVCLTAYDSFTAEVAEAAEVDLVLVGDSLGNVVQGLPTTLPVSLEDIRYHLKIVRRFVTRALLVADLPFGTYEAGPSAALQSAIVLMKEGADAVKLEGDRPDAIAALVSAGIPVMGHLGFTPQHVHAFGGYVVQGRGEQASAVLEAAQRIAAAGCFGMVLEMIPADLAGEITRAVPVPTIGIGAGPQCSGEIQVVHDVLGWSSRTPKHARAFHNGREAAISAAKTYGQSVRNHEFPSEENSFR